MLLCEDRVSHPNGPPDTILKNGDGFIDIAVPGGAGFPATTAGQIRHPKLKSIHFLILQKAQWLRQYYLSPKKVAP